MKVKELLTDARRWCQGSYALDEHGMAVGVWQDSGPSTAVKWCLIGALHRCYPNIEEYNVVYEKLNNYLERKYNMRAVKFNDSLGRPFKDIRAVVELLDI